MKELLYTNGGCLFPYWWGITPGETSWDSAKAFLTPFALEFRSILKGYAVTFPDPAYEQEFDTQYMVIFQFTKGIVDQIRTSKNYRLADFLTDYGKPTQIWIHGVSSNNIRPEAYYTIALFYKKGILAVYDGTAPKKPIIKICPSRFDRQRPVLWLWSPLTPKTFKEAAGPELFEGPPDLPFYQIGDVTNSDVDTFYQTYQDPKNASTCFDMPDRDWPKQ